MYELLYHIESAYLVNKNSKHSSSQSTGWSALFFAVENEYANALQSLLKAGANAYLKDKVFLVNNTFSYYAY